MADYPGTHPIVVTMSFPGNDFTKKPTVTNSTNQCDVITSDKTGIEWESQPDHDGLTITGVSFFLDSNKSRPVTPTFFKNAGFNFGRMNWVIEFNGEAVSRETTLYYTLHYKDNHFSGLDWDPSIQIKPRVG